MRILYEAAISNPYLHRCQRITVEMDIAAGSFPSSMRSGAKKGLSVMSKYSLLISEHAKRVSLLDIPHPGPDLGVKSPDAPRTTPSHHHKAVTTPAYQSREKLSPDFPLSPHEYLSD